MTRSIFSIHRSAIIFRPMHRFMHGKYNRDPVPPIKCIICLISSQLFGYSPCSTSARVVSPANSVSLYLFSRYLSSRLAMITSWMPHVSSVSIAWP